MASANAICKEQFTEFAKTPDPFDAEDSTLEELRLYTEKSIEVGEKLVTDLRALGYPAGDKEKLEDLYVRSLKSMDYYAAIMQKYKTLK